MPRRNPTRRTTRLPRLLERVVQQRRASAAEPGLEGERADHEQRIRALEERIDALEALLEGLQDSVHREAVRRTREFEEINRKIQPAETARTLGKHAREHGL
jgi:flagellar motility protein MotE (MotC chaperone)